MTNKIKCPHCKKEIDIKEPFRQIGAIGGSSTSEKKQNSSRENGKKGGRPRKKI